MQRNPTTEENAPERNHTTQEAKIIQERKTYKLRLNGGVIGEGSISIVQSYVIMVSVHVAIVTRCGTTIFRWPG